MTVVQADQGALGPLPVLSADAELSEGAAALIADALAPNTRRAYARWAARWDAWCTAHHRTPVPATGESLASWVAELSAEGLAGSSIGQAIGAVRSLHELAGYDEQPPRGPAAKVLRSHRRREADRKRVVRKAPALEADLLHRTVAGLDPTRAIDARDAALLLVGFTGCLRRSTLVDLDRDDIAVLRDRVTITIRRSKTDQEGRGRDVDLPLGSDPTMCPVRALEAWLGHLDAAGHTDGPLFRPIDKAGRIAAGRLTDHSASRIVGRRTTAAQVGSGFTGHSLRAGGATSMAAAGATTAEIAEHGGWDPTSGVVHGYVRSREAWERHPMRRVL